MQKLLITILASVALLLSPIVSFAQPSDPLGLDYGSQTGLSGGDLRVTVARVINVSLGLLGTIAVVLIIYAGFKWMTAGGEEEGIETAKKIIFAAVIGLIIIASAYAISQFVITQTYEATQGQVYGTF